MSQEISNFVNRYLDLWLFFNSGKQIPPGLRDTGKRYYQFLSEENVDFKMFDRICKSVEKEFLTLGYDFNLVAYVLDCVRSERAKRVQDEENFYRLPVELPATGKPIQPSSPEMEKSLEKLKKAGLFNWISLLEKINAKRISGGGKYVMNQCEACNNTGWVPLPNNSVATCLCPRGQKIRNSGKQIESGFSEKGKKQVVKQASKEECSSAACGNFVLSGYEKQFVSDVPF
ncbi:MAG: hypothetical protein V1841_01940 [Patescibacteria group bacterium]